MLSPSASPTRRRELVAQLSAPLAPVIPCGLLAQADSASSDDAAPTHVCPAIVMAVVGGADPHPDVTVGGVTLADSVTSLDAAADGTVVVCGSHAGRFAAACAARRALRGIVLSDAGGGLHNAGIAGLVVLDRIGMPAAAVDHRSARIGDGRDTFTRGVVSHVNRTASTLGVNVGMHVVDAVGHLSRAPTRRSHPLDVLESRFLIADGPPVILAVDSASLVRATDAGSVVLTGSHGGVLGSRAASALKVDCVAAVFNDAGRGRDDAGVSRLPALDERAVAAATVGCDTAEIGDGRSTYETGVLSAVNVSAHRLGARVGMSARAFADLF